jgi:hypothetical protein
MLSETKRAALYGMYFVISVRRAISHSAPDIITKISLSWKTLHISAQEIDARRAAGENLNQIEYNSALKLLESLSFNNWTEL